jgi:hypothetical protein
MGTKNKQNKQFERPFSEEDIFDKHNILPESN